MNRTRKTYSANVDLFFIFYFLYSGPAGIVLDPRSGKEHMYWVHNDINGIGAEERPSHVCIIERASMINGTGRTTIVPISHGLKLTLALTFDPFDE